MADQSSDSDDLDDLPCLSSGERFCFSCGPSQPCFNRCCAQLNLPLTPYDALKLAQNLGLPSSEFLRAFTGMRSEETTGFPMFHLRMIESPDAPCPFVTPAGCSVYEDRPSACRSYPLGRGARLGRDGIQERFFLVREEHCQGFACGPAWTAQEWFENQGLAEHVWFNDAYMRLLSLVAASGRPLDARLRSMVILALWQPDKFREFLIGMDALGRVETSSYTRASLEASGQEGDLARLRFGLDWLEFVLFGESPNIRPK